MHLNNSEVFVMRRTFAKLAVMVGFALAFVLVQGCKKQASQTQPVVHVNPAVSTVPDFPVGPMPVEKMNATAKTNQSRQQTQVPLMPAQSTDAPAGLVAAQKMQDARLLQQQQAASQRQQQELDKQVEETMQRQREMEATSLIQDAPEQPLPPPPTYPTQPQPTQPQ
jgi:hypothetical protein